jgi:MFS transporter, DHA1 family, multidrug resistance protein
VFVLLTIQLVIMIGKNSKRFLFILLGMLAAFGAFVTDMYLPGLPSMTEFFGTTTSLVQLGLTASMIGMAVGQLIFGPLSDKYGRREPLIISMIMFIASTGLCIFSSTIEMFIFLRLIQGIAGAGGIVMSRSIAADLFEGDELVMMLAVVGAMSGIAPVVSPVIGGAMLSFTDWRGVFLLLLLVGVVILVCCLKLHESHPAEKRTDKKLFAMFLMFGKVVKNRTYTFYVLQQSFAMMVFFANIASSPFIIQDHYGYSAMFFSIVFAFNAAAFAAGSLLSVKFSRPHASAITGSSGLIIGAAAVLLVFMSGGSFWSYEIIVFLMHLMFGLIIPSTTAMAMQSERANAGSASALMGAMLFIFGGLISPVVGLGNILMPTAIAFLSGAILSLFFGWYADKR